MALPQRRHRMSLTRRSWGKTWRASYRWRLSHTVLSYRRARSVTRWPVRDPKCHRCRSVPWLLWSQRTWNCLHTCLPSSTPRHAPCILTESRFHIPTSGFSSCIRLMHSKLQDCSTENYKWCKKPTLWWDNHCPYHRRSQTHQKLPWSFRGVIRSRWAQCRPSWGYLPAKWSVLQA